jgi:hypothetical protein
VINFVLQPLPLGYVHLYVTDITIYWHTILTITPYFVVFLGLYAINFRRLPP